MNFAELLSKQRTYFESGVTRSIDFRLEQLNKLRGLLQKHEKAILEALRLDLNKSEYEAFVVEIGTLYEEIALISRNLKKWLQPQRVSAPLHLKPGFGKILQEPLGVVAVFAPWNYPFQLLLSPAIGAIAAGNCVVLKPADLTSHSQRLLLKLINENFDPAYIHAIGGGVAECELLLRERFDFIFFTGSSRVGRIVMSAAAKHLTPICLELGGKSPCIVDKTANIKVAARRICWAKFLNSGQTCVAPDYIYVHRSVEETFAKECTKVIEEFFGPNPKESEYYGRIISQDHCKRVADLVDARNVYFGGDTDIERRYISPTLLRDVEWSAKVMQEEIFGPLVPLLKFDDAREICAQINARPKPLALYIFSESAAFQNQILRNTSSGGGCINDCIVHLGNPHLPFGGVGESGMGSYHGKRSVELFSHQKSIQHSATYFDSPLRYPPFTQKKRRWIDWFFKRQKVA